jgi:hypothetical protein
LFRVEQLERRKTAKRKAVRHLTPGPSPEGEGGKRGEFEGYRLFIEALVDLKFLFLNVHAPELGF